MSDDRTDAHGRDHGHDHGHGGGHGGEHEHAPLKWSDRGAHDQNDDGHYELMAEALRQLLIEKGVVTANAVRNQLEQIDARDPADGGRIVARAWTDPGFKRRLLENGTAAVAEMGFTMGDAALVVVENSAAQHNVVVCTLCSCYPRTILGLPPDWYKSQAYRKRAVHEPRAVLKEFGTEIADDVAVRVHDSNADMRYLVLPRRPAGTEGWSEERLAAIVTRDCLVGVALPRAG